MSAQPTTPQAPQASSQSVPPPAAPSGNVRAVTMLIFDLAALATICFMAKWHVLPSEFTAGALLTVITGSVAAKARGSGNTAPGAQLGAMGAVVAVGSAAVGLLKGGHA